MRLLALAALLTCAAPQERRPNVLIFLTDDQGWGDLSLNGNTNLETPHIDSLGREGAAFDRFYVCPVCSPTRAEFLTGRYHPRGGVRGVSTGGERLDLDERTVGEIFKTAGYATGAFGKWHNGSQHPYHPNSRGFDEYYGFTSGHWGHYFDAEMDHNGAQVKGRGYLNDDLTDRALAFIEGNRGRPFFCYVPYNAPHSPMQVPERHFKKFAGAAIGMGVAQEDPAMTRAALAMCENLDWNVGRVLKKLGELGLAGDTIVLYFCDNGPNSARWNGGMKGRKGSTDEGGVRSPLLVRWPGRIMPGTRISRIAGAIDLLPTLADLAGIKSVWSKPLDGMSLKPLLLAPKAEWPDRMIFSHWAGRVSVRTQRHRLDAAGKLYDMEADPGQARDVSKGQPEAERLAEAVRRWREEVLGELGKEDRAFTVGHSGSAVTYLPARDGVPHGNVARSAKPPNCSFFTNWTSPEDRITWDVEVLTAGRYEAAVYYTCAAADVGSTVELSLGEGRVQAKVALAHDPPLVGRAEDRVPRGESYVKEFKPLVLGEITLAKVRGSLILRALEVPGRQVMDVRYLRLTRR